jgi:hypothetical protein
MDIGKQKRVITVEPEPLWAPREEPVAPEPDPVPVPPSRPEPERVPAKQ